MFDAAPLPPGTLLQLMYLRERLAARPPGRFVEIGPGNGEITKLLLGLGWTGESFDLDETTIAQVNHRFRRAVADSRYSASVCDFLEVATSIPKADLVISCMVMEHLDDQQESEFLRLAAELVTPSGQMIGLVPSSPLHWGIEDDIAGHFRRYTLATMRQLLSSNGWNVQHLAGLTFPVSNVLLPISNLLVRRNEQSKLTLSKLEQTKASGRRNVHFKTHFPNALRLVLNRRVLAPLHLLQKLFRNSPRSLVVYFEAEPRTQRAEGR